MQRLVLAILACCLITAYSATSQEQLSPTGCCLAQYGYPCDTNSLPKQQCLGGDNIQCCPSSSRTFQCCVQPFFQCNFTAMECQRALTFPANPAPITIRVGTFAVSLSYLFANLNGYFQEEGIIVNTTIVGGSVAQFAGVLNGQYDVIITGADNVVNYVENAHPPFNSFNQHFDMLAFLGESGSFNQTIFFNPNGPYPNIQSFQSHTPAHPATPVGRLPIVGVDSPTSGFAFLVYTVFSSFGLKNGTDYTIGIVGGGNARLAALEKGTIDAAILGGENTLQGYQYGLTGQVNVFDVVGSVEGTIYAANRSYVDPYGIVGLPNPVLVRLTRAIYKGLQYVLDPANQAAVIAVLTSTNASVNPPAFYQINVNPPTGLYPGGNIDQIGMYNIIKLRKQYNGFENFTSDARVCNLSQPRGNRTTFRSTPTVDWLYQLDTLYESVLTLGKVPNVTPRYPTCDFPGGGDGSNGIVGDNNSAHTQSLPIMVILSFAVVLLFCVL